MKTSPLRNPQQPRESRPATVEQPQRALHVADGPRQVVTHNDPFKGPWFTSKTAAAYLCCPTVKAFYEWRRRHGIVTRNNGTVAKADLDRALRIQRRPHRIHPNSLRNLRLRRR